jgi:hypothetical protein
MDSAISVNQLTVGSDFGLMCCKSTTDTYLTLITILATTLATILTTAPAITLATTLTTAQIM